MQEIINDVLFTSIGILIVIIILQMFFLFFVKKGINRRNCQKRNWLYPFQLFQKAATEPKLLAYLQELSDECVAHLFSTKTSAFVKENKIEPAQIEKICVLHNRNMPEKLDAKILRPSSSPRWIENWCSQALFYLVENYVKGNLTEIGQKFIVNFLGKNQQYGFQLLLSQSRRTPEEFARIYSEEFFESISKLEQLELYPEALSYLIQIYLSNQAGKKGIALLEKLIISYATQLYPKIYAQLYHNNDKEFALDMIQKYQYIPIPIKIGILKCHPGSHYIKASIEKLQKEVR